MSQSILKTDSAGNPLVVYDHDTGLKWQIGDRVLIMNSTGTRDTIKGFTKWPNAHDRGFHITASLNPEFDRGYHNNTGVNISQLRVPADTAESENQANVPEATHIPLQQESQQEPGLDQGRVFEICGRYGIVPIRITILTGTDCMAVQQESDIKRGMGYWLVDLRKDRVRRVYDDLD